MDQQAATLLATLKRTSAASDSKLTLLNNLKSDIKHHRVPDSAQPVIFDCLKYAISQQTSSTLATAALTTFSHLIKRLKIQDADGAAIMTHAPKLLPALQERLGDLRESHRAGAAQVLMELWPFCGPDVENMVRDEAIAGSNVRAKDAGMQWVVKMNHDASLPFKGFVPYMVANLEDADGTVRDAAKSALVELFKTAPNGAKADLKKQLKIHGVRQGITNQVLSQIETTPGPDTDMTASTRSIPTFDAAAFAESLNSEAARPPPAEEVPMDPVFVHTQRELEDAFRDMQPFFEGRESEENWVQRDRSVTKLRRLTKGNAPTDYYNVYMAGIKQLQDGIMKVANSLRTTTSTNGCQLVQELAKTLGPALDPMVEIYLQNFIKMSAATKNIAAQNGNLTVDTLLQYVTCNVRIMQHIWGASQDKNIQPRIFAATWLRTVLSRQSGSKMHFEHTGGLDLADKTIKKGLNDPQPKVKESMRAAYWTFAKTWPDKASAIMATLDSKAQTALERDSHNPNAPAVASNPANMRAATVSRAQSRASVRDAILAARKNLGKSQNERPVSAMAAPTMSPARSKSSNNLSLRQTSATATSSLSGNMSSRTPSNPASTSRSNDSTTSSNTAANARPAEATNSSNAAARPGSLMSGAARRPIRKPEPPRSATADPYASRRLLRPETPSTRSPVNSPRQDTVASLARTAAASASRKKLEVESPVPSPARQYASPRSAIPSPRAAPASPKATMASPRPADRQRPSSKGSRSSIAEEPSLTKEEDFTLVVPTRSKTDVSPSTTRRRPTLDKTASLDTGIPAITEDDNFTMVMPAGGQTSQASQSPSVRHTPARSLTEDAAHIPHPSNTLRTRRASERSDVTGSQARAQSVPRQSSPLKTSTSAPAEEFQIHEDPFNVRTHVSSPSPQESRVLNELPVNESSQPPHSARDSPIQDAASPNPADDINKNGVLSPPASPESKTEIVRSRKLLISGIDRVKSHTLDAHGFRKVLELVRSSESGDVFGSVGEGKRFDDLCGALLEYIVEPLDTTSGNVKHTQELKRQAITVLRTLLNRQHPQYKKWISSGKWCQRTLAGSFDARKGVDGMGLLVKDIEALASDVLARVHSEDGEKAVLTWLEQAEHELHAEQEDEHDGVVEPPQNNKAKSTARATALALRTLSSLLAGGGSTSVPADITSRVARTTAACLRSTDAEVRKSAVDLATDLHGVWPATEDVASDSKNEYWALLEKSGVQEGARNLIVYFIARRARSA